MLALEREEWETFKYLFDHPAIDRTAGDKTNRSYILWMAFDKRQENRDIFEKVLFSGDPGFNYDSTGATSPWHVFQVTARRIDGFAHRKI